MLLDFSCLLLTGSFGRSISSVGKFQNSLYSALLIHLTYLELLKHSDGNFQMGKILTLVIVLIFKGMN